MKRCADCYEWKPLEEFPRNRNSKDGRHAYCKPCHNARGRETRQRLYGGSRHYHLMRRYGISFNCNGGLGPFSDNTERLANAIEYLDDGVTARIEAPQLTTLSIDRARASKVA